MESGCDNFASNLVGWCVQSPLFENDTPLRSTHLLLLHKLAKHEQLHSQVLMDIDIVYYFKTLLVLRYIYYPIILNSLYATEHM